MELLSFLILGIGFGFIHALEPDHLLGIATIVSTSRKKWFAFTRGAIWGLGHTFTILVLYILFKTLGPVTEKFLDLKLEGLVGIMLIFLGLRVCYKLFKAKNHFHLHRHEAGSEHLHFHSHKLNNTHEHFHLPFSIGIVHGMAGSGAIILALAIESPNMVLGVLYIGLFGMGSCLAMGLFSRFLVGSIDKIGHRIHNYDRAVTVSLAVIATLSCILGYEIIRNAGFF